MVFQDPKAGKFINKHFISIRINGREGNGPEFRKQFNIRGYPTTLFLNSKGVEVDRILGFEGKQNYMLAFDLFASGKWKENGEKLFTSFENYGNKPKTLTEIEGVLQQTPDDIDLHFMAAMKYAMRIDYKQANPHFEKVLQLDPNDEKGYKNESQFRIALYESRDKDNVEPLQNLMNATTTARFYDKGFSYLVRFFRNQEKTDQEKICQVYQQALKKMPENAGMMNQYAWYIYTDKLQAKYEHGIQVAKKALKLDSDNPNIWDTLAWLQFETGQKSDAIASMKKAIELAPDTDAFKKNLQKIIEQTS